MGDVHAAAAAASSPARRKRRRGGDDDGLRRVAEIVMVLAATGEMRGGREPAAAERALAAEARERLAAAVADGSVRPRDLFSGEAVRAVVEDLGLNRAKDPAALGFRPPKASIADRLMLTKRKMEEVKEAPEQPISAPQTLVSSGMSEFHGLHGASKFGVGVPRNQTSTASLNSASLVNLKPPGSSLVKPVTNSAVALSHTGTAHLKMEKDVNRPLNLACSGANTAHSTKSTPGTSASPNVNAMQSTNQVAKNQDTRPVVIQAATGNPGVAYVPAKYPFVHHNAIANIVQQSLQQPMNHPSWTPPSAEFMYSRLCCQICKAVISDVDSLLVCDTCERGAHLVCLQNCGNKGVPKVEWHCSVCLTQSKGKPLPPKYGKVTRTVVTSKAAPPVNGAQISLQGSAETKATKENHKNLAANGNPTKSISTQAGSTIQNSNVLALSAHTAGSQSQLVSNLRPSVGNAAKSEASNEKEGTGQPCNSTIPKRMNSPSKRLRSDSSLNSADSANDIMHVKITEEVSGVKCADNSLSLGATNFNSEAHSYPVPSRYEEMVDHSGAQMEQIGTVATEEKMKYVRTITDIGMSTKDQGTNSATEEKHQSQATFEPHTISDMEMTVPTGKPICQRRNAAVEEKLETHIASELPIDQSSSPTNGEKPSEQTSSLNVDVIPRSQSEQANVLNGNGLKESPCGDKNKSSSNAASDHGIIQTVAPNGVLHPKDEMLSVNENEAVDVRAEAKVQDK